MAHRMAVLAIFALLAVTASAQDSTAVTTCKECPPGYLKQTVYDDANCDFICVSPAKLNCMPPLSNPVVCGGATYKPCPTLACGYTAAYAVSGPAGCAAAKSRVDGTSYSQTSYNLEAYFDSPLLDFCENDLLASTTASSYANAADGFIGVNTIREAYDNAIVAKSVAAAQVYSEAVAYTLINYNAYVCGCCSGNSLAYATVGADVQAMASASASAYVAALAYISDSCNPLYANVLAGASQVSEAYAKDVQLAIDGVYKQIVAKAYSGKCDSAAVYNQIRAAVAKASVCVYAEAYAEVVNKYYEKVGKAYNCGTAIAIAGYDVTCQIKYGC